MWYHTIELRLRGVTITVGGLPFFYERAFVSALLVFYKEGDKMYMTFNELLLFTSVLISLITLFVMIYNHKK